MTLPPIDYDKVHQRVQEIQESIAELKNLTRAPMEEFVKDKHIYALAFHYFWKSLEAVLAIGTHILSRIPGGGKMKDYQDIIRSLGEFQVIPQEFAQRNKPLASYRNRMVHGYWRVSPEELYATIKEHLADLDQFCAYFIKYAQTHQPDNKV